MKKILNIVTSLKGKDSFSNRLSNVILEKLSVTYPESQVHTHDLSRNPLPYLEESHYTSFITPAEAHTSEHKEAIKHSDQAIKELLEADIIVIGVPFYNFFIPSTLKSWLDHIIRAGITFNYRSGVPEGLVTNKKVYLAIASGGVYSEGPMKSYDFTESYLRAVLGFLGMKDITVFRIEGTVVPDVKEKAWPKAIDQVAAYAF